MLLLVCRQHLEWQGHSSGYTLAPPRDHLKVADAWGLTQTDCSGISGGETQALVFLKSTTKDLNVQPGWGTSALETTYPTPSLCGWGNLVQRG